MEKDYQGRLVKLTDKHCESCGKQLNLTEVHESEKHLSEKYVCSDQLNALLTEHASAGC